MALYDTDKNSEDRGSPMPNHDDKLIGGAIKSHRTISTHYTTDADTNTGRLQMQNKQILGNDGTTNITLYGYNQALNKWGFFVTQAGTEVTTNTDLSKFIFNSSQDIFKIVASGTGTVFGKDNSASALWGTFTEGTTQITTPHGLGFTPVMLCYVTSSSGSSYPSNSYKVTPAPLIFQAASAFPWQEFVDSYVDSTNVYVRYNVSPNNNASGRSATFKYFLLQESIV